MDEQIFSVRFQLRWLRYSTMTVEIQGCCWSVWQGSSTIISTLVFRLVDHILLLLRVQLAASMHFCITFVTLAMVSLCLAPSGVSRVPPKRNWKMKLTWAFRWLWDRDELYLPWCKDCNSQQQHLWDIPSFSQSIKRRHRQCPLQNQGSDSKEHEQFIRWMLSAGVPWNSP